MDVWTQAKMYEYNHIRVHDENPEESPKSPPPKPRPKRRKRR